jgi:hypothetical protein
MPHQVCTRIDPVSLIQNWNEVSDYYTNKGAPYPEVTCCFSQSNFFGGGFHIFLVFNNNHELLVLDAVN